MLEPLSSSAGPIRLLVVGVPDAATAELIERLGNSAESGFALCDVEEFRRDASAGDVPSPDVLVILQDWPDQYRAGDVLEIWTRWPLARVVVAYGPWCGSDGRTRDIWPLAWRVPRESLAERLAAAFAVVRGDRAPLPATADRDEAFLWNVDTAAV
jgi:hypothetical protein